MITRPRFVCSFASILLTFTAIFSACNTVERDSFPAEEPVTGKTVTPPFTPGIVTVQFNEEMTRLVEESLAAGVPVATKSSELGAVLDGMGIKSLRRVFPDAGEFEERTRREGLHRFYYVEYDLDMPVTKAADGLSSVPGIVSVTPQLPVRMRAFNDPYFNSQWHFVNGRYKGSDINVQKVWDEFTVGKSSVIVSVVDEGVYMDHVDLSANLIPCLEDGTGSYNFNNDTPTVVPTQGHGTHVAGIISAISNNGIGVAGIAGGDYAAGIEGVKVMSCQIFDLYGNQPDIYQAIKHGADHGAVILQCSWGFSPDMDGDGFTTDEEIALYRSYTIDDLPEYKAAIDYFIKYAGCDNDGNQLPDSPMKGGVAIFAAGNDNFDYDPLVSYDPIIAVGSFGATGTKASYSNYGDWIDIAAPGGDANLGIYSTLLSNSYGGSDWQGTSMACPHVSGVAALLVSYFGGPGFTADECRSRILRGAVSNFIKGSRYIGRKLDAYGAFTCDVNAPVKAPVLSWTGETPAEIGRRAVVEIPFKVEDPSGLYFWVTVPDNATWASVIEEDSNNYRLRIDASALEEGSHSITVTARNEDQASSALSLSFKVLPNVAPAVSPDAPVQILIDAPGASESFSLNDWFNDPDGDELSFTCSQAEPVIASVSVSGDGTLSVSAERYGRTSLVIQASDGQAHATRTLILAVRNPSAPMYVYPTRASEKITVVVDAASTADISLDILSSTGSKVYHEDLQGDIFHPLSISVKNLAPGRYKVRTSYDGTTHLADFVKI